MAPRLYWGGGKKLFLVAMVKANLPKLGTTVWRRKVRRNIFYEDPKTPYVPYGSQNLNLLPGDVATPPGTEINLFWNLKKSVLFLECRVLGEFKNL
jgi:hypothetical protein